MTRPPLATSRIDLLATFRATHDRRKSQLDGRISAQATALAFLVLSRSPSLHNESNGEASKGVGVLQREACGDFVSFLLS